MTVSDSADSTQQQHDTSAPYNPLEQLISLLSLVDPVEFASKAIDTSRRTTESLISILENLASTVDNLNKTTTRVNALLDDVEEPLRRVMPQLGNAMNAIAALGETAQQLGDLSKRLGPLTTLAENAGGLFGLRPNRPSPPPANDSPGTATSS